MGFLKTRSQTVDLGDGYWAVVRELTASEFGDVEKTIMGANVVGQGDKARLHMAPDLTEFRRRLVVTSLVEWNLTDANDEPLPLPPIPPEATGQERATPVKARRQSVDLLPMWAFEEIRKAADKLNGSRDPAEVASFPEPDVGGAEDGGSGAAGAGAVPAGI